MVTSFLQSFQIFLAIRAKIPLSATLLVWYSAESWIVIMRPHRLVLLLINTPGMFGECQNKFFRRHLVDWIEFLPFFELQQSWVCNSNRKLSSNCNASQLQSISLLLKTIPVFQQWLSASVCSSSVAGRTSSFSVNTISIHLRQPLLSRSAGLTPPRKL